MSESGDIGWAMTEEWRSVIGYEGLYEVSDQGRVRRVGQAAISGKGRGGGAKIGRILVPQKVWTGYLSVPLWKDGKQHNCLIHMAVAAAFIGQCPPGKEVNHKDGKKDHSNVDNLEYLTRSENMKHAYAIGLRSPIRPWKLTQELFAAVCSAKAMGESLRSIARRLGFSHSILSRSLRRIH